MWRKAVYFVLVALGLGCTPASADPAPAREVEIVVQGGFTPTVIAAKAGEHLRIKFTRHDEGDCTHEVVFASLGLRRELPSHQSTVVDLGELKAGELDFACGMGMVKGRVVVSPRDGT